MKKILVKILTVTIAVLTLAAALPLNMLADGSGVGTTADGELGDPGYIEVSDGYVKIQVSEDNGGFYIGLVEGDKLTKADNNKHLIYPDSDYDTSFTTFRVTQDGKTTDYIFGGDYSHLGLETSEVNVYKSADNAITAEWSVGGLTFTQIIAFMDTNSAMHGMAYITYSVENKTGKAVEDIDARVMMDTTLGYQDYAIYMTANENGSFEMVSNEITVSAFTYRLLEYTLLFLYYFHFINLTLGLFNCLPIPPLDGSRFFFLLLPPRAYFRVMRYEQYISLALMLLLFFGAFTGLLSTAAGWLSDGMLSIFRNIFGLS